MAAQSSSEPAKKAMDSPPSAEAPSKPAPHRTAGLQNPKAAPPEPEIRDNAEEPRKDGQIEAGEPTVAERIEGPASGGSNSVSDAGPITDLERKLRRAERFGMPIMLSEEEKRHSRAERFGTRSALTGNNNVGQVEEQKRKARAESCFLLVNTADTFGLKVDVATDEEAKKKVRLERFAPNSKLDTSEEDKRKARAIRFSQVPSKVSQANSDLVGFCKLRKIQDAGE